MKLPVNTFKKAIADRTPQVGLWISLCNNFSAEIVAPSGYDWALLDMEHSPNEVSVVMGQLQAFNGSPTTPIVRPMWNDAVVVKRLMDVGANTFLFPMIQSPEEAEAAVRATRYPPHGIRGVSGAQRGNKFGRVTDYFDRILDETCVIVQLETRSALDQAAEIAAVDGVDGIFFGPADIGADMGILGNPMDPAIWEAVKPAAKVAMDAGKPVGTLVFDPDMAAGLIRDGFTFVACGGDVALLAKGADNLLASVRKSLA